MLFDVPTLVTIIMMFMDRTNKFRGPGVKQKTYAPAQ